MTDVSFAVAFTVAEPDVVTTVGAVVAEILILETLPFPTAVAVTAVEVAAPVAKPSAKVPE